MPYRRYYRRSYTRNRRYFSPYRRYGGSRSGVAIRGLNPFGDAFTDFARSAAVGLAEGLTTVGVGMLLDQLGP